ncbi:THIOREDOXIN-LIKE 4 CHLOROPLASTIC [Salix purpurea]|uniref:THIOREDOXIN-LIKE 4 CHLOROPLASTIC n=1 Tax=Salix purpurea TaxID=77065 RepID=A0A9Q0P063_SALPP|nr:THIOREDOXIN-LIKE 4 CHLOROPLASTIC [Salix purpurea]
MLSCKSRTFYMPRPLSVLGRNPDRQLNCRIPCVAPSFHPCRGNEKSCIMKAKFPSITKYAGLNFPKNNDAWRIKAVAGENLGELSDEDDDLCPVDCVREFKTDEEFLRILEKAKETDSFSGGRFLSHFLWKLQVYRAGVCKIVQGFW